MDEQTLSFYQKNFSSLVDRYETADVTEMHKHMLRVFSKDFPNLLEIGCGSGRDAAFMMANGYNVTAVDGSQEMIDAALDLHPELTNHLRQIILPQDLHKLYGNYDGVYSIAALMHLTETELISVIARIAGLIKSRGFFFFTVSIERDDTNDSGYDDKHRFFNKMNQSQWVELCESNNLECKHISKARDGLGRNGIKWLTIVGEKTI